MKQLVNWERYATRPNGIDLAVEGRHLLRISALDKHLFRISLLKDNQWRLDRTWTVAPGGVAPLEGRHRDCESGFACPPIVVSDTGTLTVTCDDLRLRVEQPLGFTWEVMIDGQWLALASDRNTGAILLGRNDHALQHYMTCNAGERCYGLGEKAGMLQRDGKRYEMRNLDALGYSARTTDPLYKHMPFLMVQTPGAGCWSIFYDNLATSWFDLNQERDNYHLPYRAWRAEDGDLDYYFRWSPTLLGLTRQQAELTGGTCFPPRWTLGYSASTMSYTDAENAQEQLHGFLNQIRDHAIPCDSFHLSSGYTSINGKRYVFNWNRDKFPDPERVFADFRNQGVHVIANIKPCLLNDHPRYKQAASQELFVKDSETGQPERSAFWGDWGSHLDFSNPATIQWWRDGVRRQLLDTGISSTWNDNNEYEIWDREARCAGFGQAIDIALIRPLHSQWMCRASLAAQTGKEPDKRPYLITRSGAPGLQRYAQTWSGDNYTSWETLKWNIRMGLGLSLSGFFNLGHDIGGFAGPKPEPELFLRWVQNGIFLPRFSIHSWNDDGSANEPWMYPEITDLIRDALRLRYSLIPYLYSCLWQAVTDHQPILRPTFLDHPDDEHCYEDCDDFMLGKDLLVATVVEPGQTTRTIYLPDNDQGWWHFQNEVWYRGGETINLPVTRESIPLFVRAGTVLPLGHGANRATPESETLRELRVFSLPQPGSWSSLLYEDDGESQNPEYSLMTFQLSSDDRGQSLQIQKKGPGQPTFSEALMTIVGQSSVAFEKTLVRSGDKIQLPG